MAKIKSCTDIPQSKILANILLPETADLCYYPNIKGGADTYDPTPEFTDEILPDELPCWSLNALIDILPNEIQISDKPESKYQIDIRKYDGENNVTLYQIAYGNRKGSSGSWHDMINTGEKENLIDCCVQMIELLIEHEW